MEVTHTSNVLQPIRSTWRDYLLLSKPVTTLMLVVPAIAAVFIASGRFGPSLKMILITILGGMLASAGANALNSYYDGETDSMMYHTRSRPLPAQRIEPAHARRFGIFLCLLGVAVFVLSKYWIPAALTAAGVLYYVYIYTVHLKMKTTFNSLFSGIAWAIPTLVGWSIAGTLSAQALVLFGIIVYWAPVMYMCRGIAYKRDYTKAGVPLLPVVHGDRPARSQVLVYSVLMVLMSFVPIILGMLYSFYGVAALSLGGLFLMIALFVSQNPGIKPAKYLSQYAQLYLVALFAAMVLDRIVFIYR